ncbi:bifunctional phosphoribosyl-AMP cyclohydrolase/phosphoribosyl-ATP diphosphatase HisIE [Capillibacterium thermochitinicola]|uniref:Histidine biosynthesis bifunctional protein HisIE n=1 Tax=Capillibacterium thermochitinicola TaxID=2699427 RepID=A0A8J6HYY8_9FIRM|nr:bifunctional phosphoribosyl-AMP cyclohydrolase/phosphoribosyl-ATP diphosphatase HisIE [Capillibacterium thermochitinicola]MBA2134172.1 bifunctional phosphoribosyl-AMP cyclohydrolase/phosphoribosyl-ATP diphosphatase HisIE [Capillibacterium thermochitinicola]
MTEEIRFDENGLVPAVVQDYKSGRVLMVAYMNAEALQRTRETGQTWFFSRRRNCLWMKGETSGHRQKVKQMMYDCDRDALLILVEQTGAACHTGHYSCFYQDLEGNEVENKLVDPALMYATGREGPAILYELYSLIQERREQLPEGSYTTYLFKEGLDKILKKVGEENAEVIIAAKNKSKEELVYETADLFYHLMVLLVERNIELADIFAELRRRR